MTMATRSSSPYPQYGDHVLLYGSHDLVLEIQLKKGGICNTRLGAYKHEDIVQTPFGSKYHADVALALTLLEAWPGKIICEAGTGSACFTRYLAEAVSPTGRIFTYECDNRRFCGAREDFHRLHLQTIVFSFNRDVCCDGFTFSSSSSSAPATLTRPSPLPSPDASSSNCNSNSNSNNNSNNNSSTSNSSNSNSSSNSNNSSNSCNSNNSNNSSNSASTSSSSNSRTINSNSKSTSNSSSRNSCDCNCSCVTPATTKGRRRPGNSNSNSSSSGSGSSSNDNNNNSSSCCRTTNGRSRSICSHSSNNSSNENPCITTIEKKRWKRSTKRRRRSSNSSNSSNSSCNDRRRTEGTLSDNDAVTVVSSSTAEWKGLFHNSSGEASKATVYSSATARKEEEGDEEQDEKEEEERKEEKKGEGRERREEREEGETAMITIDTAELTGEGKGKRNQSLCSGGAHSHSGHINSPSLVAAVAQEGTASRLLGSESCSHFNAINGNTITTARTATATATATTTIAGTASTTASATGPATTTTAAGPATTTTPTATGTATTTTATATGTATTTTPTATGTATTTTTPTATGTATTTTTATATGTATTTATTATGTATTTITASVTGIVTDSSKGTAAITCDDSKHSSHITATRAADTASRDACIMSAGRTNTPLFATNTTSATTAAVGTAIFSSTSVLHSPETAAHLSWGLTKDVSPSPCLSSACEGSATTVSPGTACNMSAATASSSVAAQDPPGVLPAPKTVDAIFLDLPTPWLALDHVQTTLRSGGRLVVFSPCIEQVQKTCIGLTERRFHSIQTFEILLKAWGVWTAKPTVGSRPDELNILTAAAAAFESNHPVFKHPRHADAAAGAVCISSETSRPPKSSCSSNRSSCNHSVSCSVGSGSSSETEQKGVGPEAPSSLSVVNDEERKSENRRRERSTHNSRAAVTPGCEEIARPHVCADYESNHLPVGSFPCSASPTALESAVSTFPVLVSHLLKQPLTGRNRIALACTRGPSLSHTAPKKEAEMAGRESFMQHNAQERWDQKNGQDPRKQKQNRCTEDWHHNAQDQQQILLNPSVQKEHSEVTSMRVRNTDTNADITSTFICNERKCQDMRMDCSPGVAVQRSNVLEQAGKVSGEATSKEKSVLSLPAACVFKPLLDIEYTHYQLPMRGHTGYLTVAIQP